MRAYSMDLRQKIVSAYEGGHGTLDDVADTFEVGRRTVARFLSLARAGESLWPKPHGGGYPASLDGAAPVLLGGGGRGPPTPHPPEFTTTRAPAGRPAPRPPRGAAARAACPPGPKKKRGGADSGDERQREDFREEVATIARRR